MTDRTQTPPTPHSSPTLVPVTVPVTIPMDSLMSDIGPRIRYWGIGPNNGLDIEGPFNILEHYDKDEPVQHTFTIDDVVKGIRAMAEKEPAWFFRVLDERQHDASVTDVAVQFAIFGEIKYQ